MRLIDADNLYAALNNIAAHLLETKSEPQCSMAQTIQYTMGIVMDQPTITPPPNDPLTLEELREMDGEPVWCEDYQLLGIVEIESKGQWANHPFLCGAYHIDGIAVNFEYDIEKRGLTLYRRKPEEGI